MVRVDGKGNGDSLIRVRDLDKKYHRGSEEIDVLQGLNLDVDRGDFVAFMGPSGSGKTTLLNLLGGLDLPTAGSITVAGDEITHMSAHRLTAWRARHVGFIFQMYNLIPVLTAFQNVELPLLLTRLSKADRRTHVEAALGVVSLADRMDHYPRQLSGGQEQRVAIARAIVADPTFLLCDEPTGDLDRKSAEEIMDLVGRLVREHGKTVLMVTHDPRAAGRAHTLLHLDKGVLAEGAGGRRMKFFRLVWANLRRKKVRTTLTIGSFTVALFLYALLIAIRGAFSGGADVAGVDRLNVINKVSLIMPLPFSYRDRILGVPGVSGVTYATWFGGVYQDEKNFFPQFAVDKDTWFDVYSEYRVGHDQREAFLRDRQACLVGKSLAKRFGFKTGDRLPLRGTIWTGPWEFNVAGIYEGSRPEVDTSGLLFRFDYLEERRQFGKGTVGWYVVKLANPDDAVKVTKTIDDAFANSPFETLTQTEKAFAASFAKQMGNVGFLVMVIGSVVFFTLLLVTGNTMAIAVRERTGELAVLKTVGFSDAGVLGLVLAESVLIAGQGGLFGLALARLAIPGIARAVPMIGPLYVAPLSLLLGFLLALFVGAAAGILPAVSAMRLRVVDALRRV